MLGELGILQSFFTFPLPVLWWGLGGRVPPCVFRHLCDYHMGLYLYGLYK